MARESADPVSFGTRRFRNVTSGPFLVTDAWFGGRDVLPPHHHDRTVVGITLSGEWDSVIGQRTLSNRAGVLHTEPAGETHSNHFEAGGTHVLIVQPDPKASDLLDPCRLLLAEIHQLTPRNACALAVRLIDELAYPDTCSPLAIEAGCLEILARASRATRPSGEIRPRWLDRVVDYLHAEFQRTPSLEEIARIAGVHPSHLVRAFKRAFGETPAARLRRLRVEWAARQVGDTGSSLIEIAAAAGFSDQSHFTREFRRHFGITPDAYRRATRVTAKRAR